MHNPGDDRRMPRPDEPRQQKPAPAKLLGTLRDALRAAGRDAGEGTLTLTPGARRGEQHQLPALVKETSAPPSRHATDAEIIALSGPVPPIAAEPARLEIRSQAAQPRTQPAQRPEPSLQATGSPAGKTELVRGKQKLARSKFQADPVVGWLVVIGGPGLGAYRPIYEGNNALGRASHQRIPIDFGDDTISGEEQAYIRYDSIDRRFLFIPNLAKTNIVQVNDTKPTGAVELKQMDVISIGRTQLVFVPFCGPDFDWAELSDIKE